MEVIVSIQQKTAFLYGGKRNGNDRIPVTLVYTDDMGENWITSEIDTIYNADYYYVEFLMKRQESFLWDTIEII